jgi:hypothetical protein
VRGIGCDAARRFLATVLLAPDERVALELAGWRVDRVDRFRADGVRVHQIWAVQGAKRIIYVRRGDNPRLGREVHRPGRHLGFPRSQTECTSGFVVRSRVDGSLFALTAGHCSTYPVFSPAGVFETEDVHLVMPSGQAPVTLGSVVKNVRVEANGADALLFAVHGAGLAAQEIYRGNRPPRRVAGVLPLSRQRKGRVVCFTGFVSGVDQCGRIHGQSTFPNPNPVICARGVTSRHGDSGGPVYTEPDSSGRVRAVGVLARSSVGGLNRDMCYTPIQIVLAAFGAELPTGSFAIAPRRRHRPAPDVRPGRLRPRGGVPITPMWTRSPTVARSAGMRSRLSSPTPG